MLKHTFKVDGLHCEHCDAKLNDSIRNALPIKSVTSSYILGETVVVAKESVDVIEIKKIIVGLGHRILDTKTEQISEEKKGLFSLFKRK